MSQLSANLDSCSYAYVVLLIWPKCLYVPSSERIFKWGSLGNERSRVFFINHFHFIIAEEGQGSPDACLRIRIS